MSEPGGTASEHLRAIGQVLDAINRSGGDIAPVYSAVLDAAQHLLEAESAALHRVVDGEMEVVAISRVNRVPGIHVGFRYAFSEATVVGRAVLRRTTVYVPDAHDDPTLPQNEPWTRLAVPILNGSDPVGVIAVAHVEPRPFTPDQIALLEAFAQQVAIAIENVRLFNETKEALERQSAVSDVLGSISQSPGDIAPVLDMVMRRAMTLCEAHDVLVLGVEDEAVRPLGHVGPVPTGAPSAIRLADTPPAAARAVREGRTIHIPDLLEYPEDEYAVGKKIAAASGVRTALAVPLLRKGAAIGVIILRRQEVRPFADTQIALLETFADQAAIAIENVRLFNETKEALEQQTAVAEILRLIAASPTNVRPVLKGIAQSTARFCSAENVSVVLAEEGMLRAEAHHGPLPESFLAYPADRATVSGRAVIEGRTVHVPDLLSEPDDEYALGKEQARELGERTLLAAPLMRDGRAIGALLLRQGEVRPFTPRQIGLVETFADQAAIAIENVRLFNETKGALEQQTAMSDVLTAISGSVFDLDAVLHTIAERALELCHADSCSAYQIVDEDRMRLMVRAGPSSGSPHQLGDIIDRDSPMLAAVVTRTLLTAQVDDAEEHPELPQHGLRARLAVPIIRDGTAIGSLLLGRFEPRGFTPREGQLVHTFAQQAGIAMENVRLFNDTKDALEQQTAVSDVLASIGRSAFDLPTLLGTVVERAARLCHAPHGIIYRLEAGVLRIVAAFQIPDDLRELNERFPLMPGDRGSVIGRATAERRPVRIDDALEDPEYRLREHQRIGNLRSMLGVPLLSGDEVIGAMSLWRPDPVPFTDAEVAIVTTFADQAAIAMENVRLFNETKEALDRQTAVSDILKVISASPTDIQPVLDAIASSAARFTGAEDASVLLVRDGVAETRAHYGPISNPFSIPLDRGSVTGAAILGARLVHVADVTQGDDYPVSKRLSLENDGQRTVLAAPLLREGKAIGAIVLRRKDDRGFSERQAELVEVFADQAVIAMENVRLLNETRESLERQTAISAVLGTISRSAFDLRAILDTVIENAVRLCGATGGLIFRRDGEVYRFAAVHGSTPEFARYFEDGRFPPVKPGPETLTGRVVVTRRPEHVIDLLKDPQYAYGEANRMEHTRTALGVPLLHQGEPIGAMSLWRNEVRPFSEGEIELVQTFADQAAIAIENVRLFNETKEALEQQRAVAEVLQTISRSVFDLQPVLDTVVENTARLASAEVALLSTSAGQDSFRVAAIYGASVQDPEVAALWAFAQRDLARPADARSVMGRMLFGRRVIHIEDLSTEPELLEASVILRASGARTVLAVPMLRAGQPIGGVVVARLAVRRFSDREIELVQTFADQAAIAIQNTRLFSEIRDKSQQLELASRHKSEFLANMSHELRTPLNAVIGFSEVLLQGMFGELNEKQREYQQDVLSSGRHLLSLINDILDLAKIEAGRVELELSEFSLPAALENGVTMVRERAARHGIRVDLDVDGVDRVVADERKVKQIVFNLLSNAVKFTGDGGRVGVRASRQDGEVHVSVQDTGIGVDEADRERIFEEFQQASRDPERSREGTGLGLALTKRYVELHGGRIWVESEVGRGSTFTFALPVVPPGKEG